MEDYNKVAYQNSQVITKHYSSSFYLATLLLDREIRKHVYAIYGLVRVADELVDTIRPAGMNDQLNSLEHEVYEGLKQGFSLNTIVHSYVLTAREYHIPKSYIRAFFESMRQDIDKTSYKKNDYQKYIYGSAEVVGLMCLYVFCVGDSQMIKQLMPAAQSLGSAFQKVNFLRDMQADHDDLARTYFPGIDFDSFSEDNKKTIITDIHTDFTKAYEGIQQLPKSSRYAVLAAYTYYGKLTNKIKNTSAHDVVSKRVRVGDLTKISLLIIVYFRKLLKL